MEWTKCNSGAKRSQATSNQKNEQRRSQSVVRLVVSGVDSRQKLRHIEIQADRQNRQTWQSETGRGSCSTATEPLSTVTVHSLTVHRSQTVYRARSTNGTSLRKLFGEEWCVVIGE